MCWSISEGFEFRFSSQRVHEGTDDVRDSFDSRPSCALRARVRERRMAVGWILNVLMSVIPRKQGGPNPEPANQPQSKQKKKYKACVKINTPKKMPVCPTLYFYPCVCKMRQKTKEKKKKSNNVLMGGMDTLGRRWKERGEREREERPSDA